VVPTTECFLLTDTDRLQQVLVNILFNAIKYTDEGSITITLKCSSEMQSGPETENQEMILAEFAVQDTGIGMNREQLANVFQRFFRAHQTSSQPDGSGLGLLISKNLVELMGGTIKVESEEGKGTTVFFSIKGPRSVPAVQLPVESTTERDTGKRKSLSGKRVLIVEDNELNRKILCRLVEQAGHVFRTSANGLEALKILQSETFDVIFMDIEMPVLGGLETTAKIRQNEAELSHRPTPIIGISGNVREQHSSAGLKAGLNDYICKPFSKETIWEKLDFWSSEGHTQCVKKQKPQ